MAPTTRSRGGTLASLFHDELPQDVDGAGSKASTKSATKGKKDKVYRKAAPKPELQQQKFPAKAKTVRPKKSNSNKRLSLPNPSTSSARKGKKKVDDEEDRKQKTLTQMRWVPSTYPSGDEGWNAEDDELEDLGVSPFSEDEKVEASGTTSGSKKKVNPAKKKAAGANASSRRGRKRRKTTGDLELELEREDGDGDEEVSSSRYHTQTLTQMPSWQGLSGMVEDSDDDIGFDFGDDLPRLAEQEPVNNATPPSKKRKRQPSPRTSAGVDLDQNLEDQISAPDLNHHPHAPDPAAPESTNPSVVPETPHHPRVTRTEIPSSQPSPFTPNVDIMLSRYLSPLNHDAHRSPLTQRSTNVDAPAPTPSALRKRTRSEIPDSWSTVNGGLPSSGAASRVKRTPLKEIHYADYSIELGEGSDRPSQRTGNGVVMDSDDEFEGLSEDEIEAPGTPTPAERAPEQPDEAAAIPGTRSSYTATAETLQEEAPAEIVPSTDDRELVASTPAKQVTVPEDVISRGPPGTPGFEINGGEHDGEIPEREPQYNAEVAATPTQAASAGTDAAQQRGSRSGSHRGSDRAASAEVMGTPMLSVPKTPTQQPSSRPPSERKATPEAHSDEDENTEAETPSHARRRPSSSSAVDKETPFSSPHKTSPPRQPVSQLANTQFGYTQLGYKSQAFESQRVPFEIIRQWAPQTDHSDVIVSVDEDEIDHIVNGRYAHLFRDFRLPKMVQRIWLYITAPAFKLKYMASITEFKLPDDMEPHKKGMGVAEFRDRKSTKYAYELLQVYELNNPVSLDRMREQGWVEQTPSATRFTYVPPAPLGALLGNLRCAIFEEPSDESQDQGSKTESQGQGSTTESQEVLQQLRSDIEHSTQQQRRELAGPPPTLDISPSQQPFHRREQYNEDDLVIPSSQDMGLGADAIRATPVRTKFTNTKQVVFAKPKVPPPSLPKPFRSHYNMEELEVEHDSPPGEAGPSMYPSQQQIVKSTVRPSQATTLSAPPTPTQERGPIEYCTIPDSPSPARPSASATAGGSGKDVVVIDDSPIPLMRSSSGQQHPTQSSLGLTALLASSQGFALGENDSLLDDSRVKLPPRLEEIAGWDDDDDEEE